MHIFGASLVAQKIKNLPADPLEKGMATYCSILGWRIPWTEEPGRLQSMGSQVGRDWSDYTMRVFYHRNTVLFKTILASQIA